MRARHCGFQVGAWQRGRLTGSRQAPILVGVDGASAALGAILGALVGDAAGAVLELAANDAITDAAVEHALTLPGGGVWQVAPGQVTDDGELTMCLLQALAEAPGDPRPAAAARYAEWAAGDPFDIGITTARSLGCLRCPERRERARKVGIAQAMEEAARELCMDSKANGSLMRATPLGVWGAFRDEATLVEATRADVRLSHPNASCVDATVAYVLAIASLVRAPGDARRALDAALSWADREACDEVRGWLAEATSDAPLAFGPHIGFVRIALSHAFRHLARDTPYVDALRQTLRGGGDTDTNACIVGGLVGARWGEDAIPAPMRERVLACDTSTGASPRPPEVHPREAAACVRALLAQGAGTFTSFRR